MTRPRSRYTALGGIGLASAMLTWLVGLTPFFQTVEWKTYDFRVRQTANPADARRDIVLVAIDDSSIRRLEPRAGRWPWPRVVHASLVDFLTRAPARVIVYDILFTERDRRTFQMDGETWSGEESDRELAKSVERAGNVVVAVDVTAEEMSHTEGIADEVAKANAASIKRLLAGQPFDPDPAFEPRTSLILPYDELTDAAAAVGHNLTILDADGPVRRTAPFVRVGAAGLPSLAMAAAVQAARLPLSSINREGPALRVGESLVPLVAASIPSFYGPPTSASRMLVRFTGPVLHDSQPTYQEYSFYDVFYSEAQLLAGQKPLVDPAVFRDKIVIVGTSAAGLRDLFTVPFALGNMPGAQIHANVVDDLLSGRFMRPLDARGGLAVLTLCALLVALAGATGRVWGTVVVAAMVLGTLGGVSLALFGRGVWMEVARPAMGVALATFGSTAYLYFVEGREKRLVKQMFSRFVSRDVYDQLMRDPSRARLGGERREMTVLFSDIRGFTTFTERGKPDNIVAQLNNYFTRMVSAVFRHRGTVDKFVGDMIMVLFGAPLPDPDHADHAVAAALDMLRDLDDLNARWRAEGRPALDIGIGINSGEMVAGNIGSDTIMSYTVIGDAVNLGSRIESLNKQYGTHIIISEHTRRCLKGRYDMKPLGSVIVKGKSEAVEIFEVRRLDPEALSAASEERNT